MVELNKEQEVSVSDDAVQFNQQLEEQYPDVFNEPEDVDRVLFTGQDGRYLLDGDVPLHLDVPPDMAKFFREAAEAKGQNYEEYLTESIAGSLKALTR